jgi:hypothetical protein
MTLLDFEEALDAALSMVPSLSAQDVLRLMPRVHTLELVLATVISRKALSPVGPVPVASIARTVKTGEAAKLLGISVASLNSKVVTEPAFKALVVNNGSRIRSYYVDRIERMMAEKVR